MTPEPIMELPELERYCNNFALKLQALYGTEAVWLSAKPKEVGYQLALVVNRSNGEGRFIIEEDWDGIHVLGATFDILRTKIENAMIRFALAA